MKYAILFLLLFVVGCSTTSIFVGPSVNAAITWSQGEARKYYAHNEEVVTRAVRNALAELKIPILNEQMHKSGYRYILAGDQKHKFGIRIYPTEQSITLLKCRVNLFGDKALAELLYKEVDSKLNVIDIH